MLYEWTDEQIAEYLAKENRLELWSKEFFDKIREFYNGSVKVSLGFDYSDSNSYDYYNEHNEWKQLYGRILKIEVK